MKWVLATLGLVLGGIGIASIARASGRRAPVTSGDILVMGDSIAVGVGQALSQLYPHVDVRAEVGESVDQTEARLLERTRDYLDPVTVVLSTGTNSLGTYPAVELSERVSEIVHDLRGFGHRVIVLGPPPAMAYAQLHDANPWGENLQRFATLEQYMLDFVDLWELLGEPGPPWYYAEEFGAPDGLHPTRVGYQEIARAILEGE